MSVPHLSELLAHPTEAALPQTIEQQFTLLDRLKSYGLSDDQIERLLPYIERLPLLLQCLFMRTMVEQSKGRVTRPWLCRWIKKHAVAISDPSRVYKENSSG